MTCIGCITSSGGIIPNKMLIRNQSWVFLMQCHSMNPGGHRNMTDCVSRIEVETSRMSGGNCNFMVRLLDNHSQPGVYQCHKYCKTKSYVLPLSCDRNAYGTFCHICQLSYTARTEITQSVRRLRYGMDSRRIVVGFPERVRDVSFIQSFETVSGAH